MPPARDLYRVLGVPADATRQEIVHAYRRLAHASHPDTQPDDDRAVARFHDVTAAYEVLTDPARRADYDRAHTLNQPSRTPPPDPAADRDYLIASLGTPLGPSVARRSGRNAEPLVRAGPVKVSPPPSMRSRWPTPPNADDHLALVRWLVAWVDDGWSW